VLAAHLPNRNARVDLPKGIRYLGKHLGHPRLVHVGEVAERAQSETDVFAWVLAIPGAHQIANAHVTDGKDGVQINVVAFDGALADGRELHGTDVFQRRYPAAFDVLDRTDHVVSVPEDAVFETVDLPEEGALIVLAYRDRKAGRVAARWPGLLRDRHPSPAPARQTQREPLAASGEALQNESLLTDASPVFPDSRARVVTLPMPDRAGIEPFGKARG
jgi:hypothetical protein